MSMLGMTGVMITPSRCTSVGSLLVTCCTRLDTCTNAWLMSVPGLNTTWMLASPALVASEVMYLMPQAPLMDCSRGMITDSASDFALAPGYEADTITTGGATSGNCDVGRVLIASTPMNRITSDRTM